LFFEIEEKKYVTLVDYRSKNRFKRLLEGYSQNAKIYTPKNNDLVMFINLNVILDSAYKNLENKQKASKLIYALMAQNDISNIN
jgi:hypothetical protein